MGDMGERFGIGIKLLALCLIVWMIGTVFAALLNKVANIFRIDVASVVNAVFIMALCIFGWIALRWSDRNKKLKK